MDILLQIIYIFFDYSRTVVETARHWIELAHGIISIIIVVKRIIYCHVFDTYNTIYYFHINFMVAYNFSGTNERKLEKHFVIVFSFSNLDCSRDARLRSTIK